MCQKPEICCLSILFHTLHKALDTDCPFILHHTMTRKQLLVSEINMRHEVKQPAQVREFETWDFGSRLVLLSLEMSYNRIRDASYDKRAMMRELEQAS